ncbi:hypothetical protein ACNOYE_21765 [Nannocystaceae bacterium ST9]
MKRPPFVLVSLLLCGMLACESGDDSSDDVAESGESGESGESDTTDTTDGATSDGDPLDFPPVECGAMTCGEGLICLEPSPWCDYGQNPPMWVYPEFSCAAPPAECVGLKDQELSDCLWATLCEGKGEYEFPMPLFDAGVLDCPFSGLDCF